MIPQVGDRDRIYGAGAEVVAVTTFAEPVGTVVAYRGVGADDDGGVHIETAVGWALGTSYSRRRRRGPKGGVTCTEV